MCHLGRCCGLLRNVQRKRMCGRHLGERRGWISLLGDFRRNRVAEAGEEADVYVSVRGSGDVHEQVRLWEGD